MLTADIDIDIVRRCYADHVRFAAGLKDRRIVDALATVPRERYLDAGPWHFHVHGEYALSETADPRELYRDIAVAIDVSRRLNNGNPSTLAKWIEMLDLQPGEHVLHVGCGVGYYTAILAEVVGAAGHVTAVEIDEELARRARSNLVDYARVDVVCGDGVSHDPGTIDAALINAGMTHPHRLWLDRLTANGRLLLPITTFDPTNTTRARGGRMLRVRRIGTTFQASFVSRVSIYASPVGRDDTYNQLISDRLSSASSDDVRTLRLDRHQPDDHCWLHGDGFCLSTLDEP